MVDLRDFGLLLLPVVALAGLVLILLLQRYAPAERKSVALSGSPSEPGRLEKTAVLLLGLTAISLLCRGLFRLLLPVSEFGFLASSRTSCSLREP